MKKIILFFLSFIIVHTVSAQFTEQDSLSSDKWLHRWQHDGRFSSSENSFGIIPSIQGVNELYFGLGLSKGFFVKGEFGGGGYGATIGIDYNPIDEIWAPKVNLWYNPVILHIFGLNLGINGSYYIDGEQTNFILRPEVGIGYYKIFLNYGRNFFIKDSFTGISKHTLTLSYYCTLLPLRKKRLTNNKPH